MCEYKEVAINEFKDKLKKSSHFSYNNRVTYSSTYFLPKHCQCPFNVKYNLTYLSIVYLSIAKFPKTSNLKKLQNFKNLKLSLEYSSEQTLNFPENVSFFRKI